MAKLQLTANEYGFDINIDNPFVIFRYLNQVAVKKVGVEKVLDMSRGDPGYGFAPNARSRRFYAFLVSLDTIFNNFDTHFKDRTPADEATALAEIKTFAEANYATGVAKELLADLDEFIQKIVTAANKQGYAWTPFNVLFELFKYATVSGGCYHDPYGELISRIVVSDYHTRMSGVPVKATELVCTNGASHAIGTFFEAFGEEGAGFLKKGDPAMITSPVYFPYMGILEHRGMDIHICSTDPENGQLTNCSISDLKDAKPKVLFVIDPDNPTGFTKNEESLKQLAEYARKCDALIVSDEVYSSFFPGKRSILEFAPERTIKIDARSKIERATGCRFGEYVVLDEANEYLTNNTLKGYLPKGIDLRTYLHDAKAPGGVRGDFKHTTFVSGPGQILAICHILLGDAERQRYLDIVKQNCQKWYETLGIPWKGNLYYSLFDLNDLASPTKKNVRAEKKLLDLAERGVVLIPANRFFSMGDRHARDRTNYVRASLPNLTTEQIIAAAATIRDYLKEA